MDIDEARVLAEGLMRQHHLTRWVLVFDGARARAGVCRFARHEIGLSRVLTALHGPDLVRETVLHEIAHALVGPQHAHDAVWQATARAIGSDGRRRMSASAPRPVAPWVGTCPRGHEVTRHRRPARPASCPRCAHAFDLAHLLVWRLNGREVPMSATYQSELADMRSARERDAAVAVRAHLDPTRQARTPVGDLPPGTQVVLGGHGKYAGLAGCIEKRGRTRYWVRTRIGIVTAPFNLVRTAAR